MDKKEVLFEVQHIYKSFSGVPVLKDLGFSIKKGEIHALMGENGAGKSTIIKIITGIYTKDAGSFLHNGKEVKINGKKDSEKIGISTIFQELSLIPVLSVAENIYLGKESVNIFGKVNKKERLKKAQELIDQYEFPLRADEKVENLSIAQKQLVEILKALSTKASILIMDEPTASLTTTESQHLFKIIRELSYKGVSILYISHRMEEVYALSDAITVLRDGRRMGTYARGEVEPEEIIRLMIGKDITDKDSYAEPSKNSGKKPVLEVEHLKIPGVIQDVSFQVYPGEILGLSGLIGAGRTEVLRAVFGADPTASGSVKIKGNRLSLRSVKEAVKYGIGYVPEDRALEGFVPLCSIKQNLMSSNLDWVKTGKFFVNVKKEEGVTGEAITKFDIRPDMPDQLVINLSGGNQQKVVLGKWLERDLTLLLVDEPTAGVDVGAKDEIYRLLKALVKDGGAVLLVSSDLNELLKLSNRILVLRNGGIIKEALGGSVNEEQILAYASGLRQEEEEIYEQ